ncbi:hypothetical protein DFH05DRAFT_1393207, partial [Lentinula detonsa]
SDGQSAQHKVDAEEAGEQAKGARRGPSNASMQHFRDPVAVKDLKKGNRWEFQCKYCSCIRSVERTVTGKNLSFDDEPKLPKLNNLATHANDCKGKATSGSTDDDDKESTMERLNLKESVKFMKNYLKDGELNPEAITTERGFLRLFAAWILDEDLPWTTGEAPSLALLFKYLKVRYSLPSDTTLYSPFHFLHCISLTTDNASVNDIVVATVARSILTRYGIEWNPDGHIRCIAHVINLAVQDALASMDEADWSDNFDYFALNKDAPIHYDVEADEEQIAMEAEADWEDVNNNGDVEMQDLDEMKKTAEDKKQRDESDQTVAESMKGKSPLRRVCLLSLPSRLRLDQAHHQV